PTINSPARARMSLGWKVAPRSSSPLTRAPRFNDPAESAAVNRPSISAVSAGSLNLGALVRGLLDRGATFHPSDILALAGLFIVVIAETGRVPVDNPATHLELTMIHAAMVLEYSGSDLALVEWAAGVQALLLMPLLAHL